MKCTNLAFRLLLAASFGVASFGLSAQDTDRGAPDQAVADAATLEQVEAADPAELDCIRDTGTRIKPRRSESEDCLNLPGRSYSRKEIERTGHIDLAQALRSLDPSIR